MFFGGLMVRLLAFALGLFIQSAQAASAAQVGQPVAYKSPSAQLEGYLSSPQVGDKDTSIKRPAVIIVHDWMGLSDFQKQKADELAKNGFVAFAADIYGKNVRPKDQKEAGEFASKYKDNRSLLRERIGAAYDVVKNQPNVDPQKIVVMGYCFGGTTALELARSGAQLAGTVSFHGGLNTPTPQDAKNIKGTVLALHGADDPWVPANEVAAFKKEMAEAKVPLTFVAYPGAVHAFTLPAAGNDNSKGAAYNADADKKSWIEFMKYLKKTTGV
jgi:dienelactone hydrolase